MKRKRNKEKNREEEKEILSKPGLVLSTLELSPQSLVRTQFVEHQTLHIFFARQLQKLLQTLPIHFKGGTTLRVLDFNYSIGKYT